MRREILALERENHFFPPSPSPSEQKWKLRISGNRASSLFLLRLIFSSLLALLTGGGGGLEVVAMAIVVAERGKERRLEVGGRRGQEDGFIYLSRRSSLYFTARAPPPPPLEADTKTNGLSSRSCKTSRPPRAPPNRVCPPDGDSPSNANVKHRRGEEELPSTRPSTDFSTIRPLLLPLPRSTMQRWAAE